MRISVVLVRTEQPGNIGAAARALTNMGGGRLVLIDPRCEIDASSYALAATAKRTLDDVVRYDRWEDFYEREGEGLRIALTRRAGKTRKVFPLVEKLDGRFENLYLIFGPEADGLSAEDMAYANFSCYLPTFNERASLNLAQAVLLACYLARKDAPTLPPEDSPEAIAPFYFPDDLIKEWLTTMGFDVNARKQSAYLTLRRLFLQNQPTAHEINVLESILRQNIRKLRGLSDP